MIKNIFIPSRKTNYENVKLKIFLISSQGNKVNILNDKNLNSVLICNVLSTLKKEK